MKNDTAKMLRISPKRLGEINKFLIDPKNEAVRSVVKLINEYGGAAAINRKAAEAGKVENLLARLKKQDSPYYPEVLWLKGQRDKGAFVSMKDYCRKHSGACRINRANAVTLEISALQYFPFLIKSARQAIARRELMPGRFVRVRNMKEQVADLGDILGV